MSKETELLKELEEENKNTKSTKGGKKKEKKSPSASQLFCEKFQAFHLDSLSKKKLKELYNFIKNQKSSEIQTTTGIILMCDHKDYARSFVNLLDQALLEDGLVVDKYFNITPDLFKNRWERFAVCEGKRLVFFEEPPLLEESTSIRKQADQTDRKKKEEDFLAKWALSLSVLEKNPNFIPLMILDRNMVNSTYSYFDHIYYRVFTRHLNLYDLRPDEVAKLFFHRMEEKKHQMDINFHEEMSAYIKVVYPGADLKGEAFISDLVKRVEEKYYSKENLPKSIDKSCVPFYFKPSQFSDILKRFDDLPGMESVKEQFETVYYAGRRASSSGKRFHMVFTGNPGTGKSTVAAMMGELLHSMGIIKKRKIEKVKASKLISPLLGMSGRNTHEACEKAYDGVLFIDEAYLLRGNGKDSVGGNQAGYDQCIAALIQEMEENADRLVVILAGYEEEMEALLDYNEGLRSRIAYEIRFPDYKDKALMEIFIRKAQAEGFLLEKNTKDALTRAIDFIKFQDNFGNARSVEILLQDIIAKWQKRVKGVSGAKMILKKEDIEAAIPEKETTELAELSGLQFITEQLENFKKVAAYKKAAAKHNIAIGNINLHMVFSGNAGTGKTTVATVFARELYSVGILSRNSCVIATQKDLLSPLEGQTAKNMDHFIRKAMGGVLFIDEAYFLIESSHGHEAVETLLVAMEAHKGEFVVIFSGYPREMAAFLASNSGLESRVGYSFDFPDYDVMTLTEMYLRKITKAGFVMTRSYLHEIMDIMEYFSVLPDFGNGRFVDKVFDLTVEKRARRGFHKDDFADIIFDDIPTIPELLQKLGLSRYLMDPSKVSKESLERIAVHECGHAIVEHILFPGLSRMKVSIKMDPYSYGRVSCHAGLNPTELELLGDIAVCFGGRNAEKLIYKNHSVGCAGDYEDAKKTARDMIEKYAMGPYLEPDGVIKLLESADSFATQILQENEVALRRLSKILMTQKVIDLGIVSAIVKSSKADIEEANVKKGEDQE